MANRFGFSLCISAFISTPSLAMHLKKGLEALADPTCFREARRLSRVSAEEYDELPGYPELRASWEAVEPRRGTA